MNRGFYIHRYKTSVRQSDNQIVEHINLREKRLVFENYKAPVKIYFSIPLSYKF